MHGFSGRQLQQDQWRENLAKDLGIAIPRSDDKGAEDKHVAAEKAFDAKS